MCRSVPQIAVFSSFTRTSFGPGDGTGTCSIQMPLPGSRLTSAFIIVCVIGAALDADGIRAWRGSSARIIPAGAAWTGWRARLEALPIRDPTMRLSVLAATLSLAAVASPSLHASEGMWVPQQLPEIAGPLSKAGLALPPEQLADLTGDP